MIKKSPIILTVAIIVIAIYAVGNALAGGPGPGPYTTKVSVKVNPGALSMTTPSTTATLTDVTLDGNDTSTTGSLGTISVADARGTGQGWYVTAQATNFVERTTPSELISNTGFTVEAPFTVNQITGNGGVVGSGGGLAAGGATLMDAAAVTKSGRGINQMNPSLKLLVPADTFAGTYDSTITETLTSH